MLNTEALTVEASRAPAYINLDNRALILGDGLRATMLPAASFPWIAETLDLLLAEKRATRNQHQAVFGGVIREDGSVILYAGAPDDLVSLTTDQQTLSDLVAKLRRR
jgi:hypothetical protein